MSVRAGIVVTGTEVLSGIVADANGPWLSERLRELGAETAHIMVVGDRPRDLRAALEFLAAEGMSIVVTSGGLGPTADDLTAEVVAEFAERAFVHDAALEERVWAIVSRLRSRWAALDEGALRAGARKQAFVPEGATVLEPVGTAPGLVVQTAGPAVVVLPGPPRELRPMWSDAVARGALRDALAGAARLERRIMRLYGIPESEIAETLRVLERDGAPLDRLEITTCLRGGEIEIATAFGPGAEDAYAAFAAGVRARHANTLFSDDGRTVDEIVARLLVERGETVATAESCTGGLMAARLTDRAGSSAYVLGGVVVYANEAKVTQAGVDRSLIERHGAVSPQVAGALCAGARERLGASVGIGITGIAGPGGAVPGKPVGTVCVCVGGDDPLERTVHLPGDRAEIRDRTTTVVMHLLRRWLTRT